MSNIVLLFICLLCGEILRIPRRFFIGSWVILVLFGFAVWQPKAAKGLAEAVDAAPDEIALVGPAIVLKHRPIHPGAWTQVIDSKE